MAEAATAAVVAAPMVAAGAADFTVGEAVVAVSTVVAGAADVQLRQHLVVAAMAAGGIIIPVRPIAAARPCRIARSRITPVVRILSGTRDARAGTRIRTTLVQPDRLTPAIALAVRMEPGPTHARRLLTWDAAVAATRPTPITQLAAV
jgi:hypothetical protein